MDNSKKVKELLEELGPERCFGLGVDLIINTTNMNNIGMGENNRFMIFFEDAFAEHIEKLGLGVEEKSLQLESEPEEYIYDGFTNKGDNKKVH